MKETNKGGYGDLTNLISIKQVLMTEHMEGTGKDDTSPMRRVMTFFTKEGEFLARYDMFKQDRGCQIEKPNNQ
jgi:hypothetical protein